MKATNVDVQEEVLDVIENENLTENISIQSTSKVGTWISVGIVGIVILATYFVLFGFYMARV